ncbi:hypothetical protein FO488_04795 [Geobacter sp. FeAm09]|uniref:hypothetical protein n=1 Tax=Geobacter sp. FeAm09 TaxID=2597769 RepID=UPI0011EEA4C4|nr:hypothetical protein [Geobacter sp. FeAm09]QEM67531.1 hypothetical protein FO488_04795 [Geobacter sp. FeAm09]
MTTTATTPLDMFTTAIAPRPGGNAPLGDAEGAVLLARRFPRDQGEAFERIMAACRRAGLARAGLYTCRRDGADVSGPSIRLAEAIAQGWGNIQELAQQGGEATVRAYAWDVESNTRQEKVFLVRHRRAGRPGAPRAGEGRDGYEVVASQGARRLRACILGVVPGDVVEAAVEQCEETLARTDASPAARARLVDAFAACGVSRGQVEAHIGCPLEAATPAQVAELGKIGNSLRDGMSAPGDWFAPQGEAAAGGEAPPQKGAAGLKERLRRGAARKTAEPAREV